MPAAVPGEQLSDADGLPLRASRPTHTFQLEVIASKRAREQLTGPSPRYVRAPFRRRSPLQLLNLLPWSAREFLFLRPHRIRLPEMALFGRRLGAARCPSIGCK